ncbi:MAG: RDD family protein [Solirubrobacteraceae bacterium]|nr:RDD family protein [Solirubrobacteraceae bacterium]
MPTHHSSQPVHGLVVMSGVPGGGGGPSFEKPAGSLHQPGQPGLPGGGGLPGQPYPPAGSPMPQGGTYELSGWWRRVGAALIDGIIISVPVIPIVFIVAAIFGISFSGDDTSDAGVFAGIASFLVLGVVYLVAVLLYAPYFMSKWNGATPGKRATGIRVVRADGQPMTFGFAALREVAVKWLLFGVVGSSVTIGIAQLLDYLWPLWDSENRSLHDLIVNTRVVRG